MAKANQPNRDLRPEASDMTDELPDETASGRLVHDDGTPADGDQWAEERANLRTKAPTDQQQGQRGQQQGQQGQQQGQSTSMRDKRGNQPPPNPPNR
jgi:hypothetical protein